MRSDDTTPARFVSSHTRSRTFEQRFWEKVDRRTDGECWEWLASKNDGYGHLRVDRQHMEKAHRISYRLNVGPIPPGMAVMHRCDNPACVNPRHLELGTLAENNHDRNAKGRQAKGARLSEVKRGELHGAAVLTECDVLAIRARHDVGARNRDLAAEYGVEQSTISAVVRRRSWKHLP